MQGVRLNHLRWQLGLKNMLTDDSFDLSGGLAVLWHESIDVKLWQCSRCFFDLDDHEDQGGGLLLFMGSRRWGVGNLCGSY